MAKPKRKTPVKRGKVKITEDQVSDAESVLGNQDQQENTDKEGGNSSSQESAVNKYDRKRKFNSASEERSETKKSRSNKKNFVKQREVTTIRMVEDDNTVQIDVAEGEELNQSDDEDDEIELVHQKNNNSSGRNRSANLDREVSDQDRSTLPLSAKSSRPVPRKKQIETNEEPMNDDNEDEELIRDDSFSTVQAMLERGECYVDENSIIRKGSRPHKPNRAPQQEGQGEARRQKCKQGTNLEDNSSEVTIYRNAVEKLSEKRGSSSSEDGLMLNSSDEIVDNSPEIQLNLLKQRMRDANLDHLIPDSDKFYDNRPRASTSRRQQDQYQQDAYEERPRYRTKTPERDRGHYVEDRSRSDHYRHQDDREDYRDRRDDRRMSPEEKAENVIRQAEASKARMMEVPGIEGLHLSSTDNNKHNLLHSVIVDEEFSVVAAHVDETTRRKIKSSMYMDFARLLPCDKIFVDEEQTGLRLVNTGGEIGVAPAIDRNIGTINSYSVWNQAFCVFTHVYTNKYPYKATELTQYNHIIRTAATTYRWDNVYKYDQDFHIHISKNPLRS